MNRKYFEQMLTDVMEVNRDDKNMCIISAGKCVLAYETATMLADELGLYAQHAMLRCEDGKRHEHVFITDGSNKHSVADALALIERCKAGTLSRPQLQLKLGWTLGYGTEEIVDFIASETARTCPCDCCGGPFVEVEVAK